MVVPALLHLEDEIPLPVSLPFGSYILSVPFSTMLPELKEHSINDLFGVEASSVMYSQNRKQARVCTDQPLLQMGVSLSRVVLWLFV